MGVVYDIEERRARRAEPVETVWTWNWGGIVLLSYGAVVMGAVAFGLWKLIF